jgi:hypothetical protein
LFFEYFCCYSHDFFVPKPPREGADFYRWKMSVSLSSACVEIAKSLQDANNEIWLRWLNVI